jgi:hypothetical protein
MFMSSWHNGYNGVYAIYHVTLDKFIVKIFFCGEFDWLIGVLNLTYYLA